jgi:type IV secretory pathway VirB2 component (pilin)
VVSRHFRRRHLPSAAVLCLPALAFAQASPFNTGATSLVSFALTIATPIAVLIVIGLAIAAAVGKIAWGWVIGAIVGIAAIFGAPQIVAWIRSMFGV